MVPHFELALELSRLQAVKYCNLASTSLLAFDWLACLPEEIEHIWLAKRWNVATLLYIFSRYSPFVDTPLTLVFYVAPGITPQTCGRIYHAASVSATIGTATSEMVLGLRTYALYGCSRRVAVLLGAFGLALNAATIPIAAIFYRSLVFGPPLHGEIGCNLVAASSIITGSYLFLLAFEIVIVCMTAHRAIEDLKGSREGSLLQTFFRDGLLSFFCLLALSLAYTVISFAAPKEYMNLLWQIIRVLHSIICCRIVLNLRDVAAQPPGVDVDMDTMPLPVDLRLSFDSEACASPHQMRSKVDLLRVSA